MNSWHNLSCGILCRSARISFKRRVLSPDNSVRLKEKSLFRSLVVELMVGYSETLVSTSGNIQLIYNIKSLTSFPFRNVDMLIEETLTVSIDGREERWLLLICRFPFDCLLVILQEPLQFLYSSLLVLRLPIVWQLFWIVILEVSVGLSVHPLEVLLSMRSNLRGGSIGNELSD